MAAPLAARGRAADPPRATTRAAPARPRRRMVLGALCLAVVLAPVVWLATPLGDRDPIQRAARPHAFDLLPWEVGQLSARLPALLPTLARPPAAESVLVTADEADAVREFFVAVEAWQQAERRGAPAAEVDALRAAWQAARPPAERAISRTLEVLAVREGLTASLGPLPLLLPPPSFAVTDPPRVLVVSPRDRVEVTQSVLLQPDLPPSDADALETRVADQGVSALVVTIGGIATYPAIVPLHGSPYETLSAIAHEWLHGYLFFHPLGRAFFASYDGRSLNETVAELGGRELGRALAAAYGYPTRRVGAAAPSAEAAPDAAPGASADGDAARFDFRREMRATRLQLDALLAAGAVDEAEQYLEARRQEFVAAGYPIRKLNQAYFAFYGSYGDSAAAVSPLNAWVRELRARRESLGAFLRQVAEMSAPADVAAALGLDPPPS
jgi:hypothetical protein